MAAYHTENDILKALVRKGALTEICKDLNTQIISSPRTGEKGQSKQDSKEGVLKDQMRLVAKIWTALSKLIRSQASKGRIIDSLFFGSFGKTSVMTEGKSAESTYSYCPGPRSIFNLIENNENIRTVPQTVSKLIFNRFLTNSYICR